MSCRCSLIISVFFALFYLFRAAYSLQELLATTILRCIPIYQLCRGDKYSERDTLAETVECTELIARAENYNSSYFLK